MSSEIPKVHLHLLVVVTLDLIIIKGERTGRCGTVGISRLLRNFLTHLVSVPFAFIKWKTGQFSN